MTKPLRRLAGRTALAIVLVAVLLAGGLGVLAWHPAIAPVPPTRSAFAANDIARGASVAALGDCMVCHTTQHGPPFAGGRPIPTPFGTVFASNITPDPATGIGTWSLAAFRRALRDGVNRQGHQLYPVLPYPHFIRATDADIAALYAFQMTRAPVRQSTPPSALPFPLNWRPLLAGWNLLFLRHGPWQPDPARDPVWNRGAYLVEAIGHCGACHSPHNALGAEAAGHALSGGEAEGWVAPALQAGSTAPQGWSVTALETYFRTGLAAGHGAAAGPMTDVTAQLASVPDADVHAMAVYIASLMPAGPAPAAPSHPAADPQAVAMFAGACGGCHGADAPMTRAGAPTLALSSVVNAPTPRDAINMILYGLPWREGHAGPYMPGFADVLTDDQVAAIATYLRGRSSDRPAWQGIAASVQAARHGGGAS